jgi:hypothetical protein
VDDVFVHFGLLTMGSPSLNHYPIPFGLSLSKPGAALRQAQRERFCIIEIDWASISCPTL